MALDYLAGDTALTSYSCPCQVSDPMEFTHCRYTPVVTEVRHGCHCQAVKAAICRSFCSLAKQATECWLP